MYPIINRSPCPILVEDHKNHLRNTGSQHLSFSLFCRKQKTRTESVRQWMRRHGLSVSKLRHKVVLEMLEDGSLFSGETTESGTGIGSDSNKKKNFTVLKGVSITFTDGTVVNIREAPALILSDFLDSYNQLCDKNYVLSE